MTVQFHHSGDDILNSVSFLSDPREVAHALLALCAALSNAEDYWQTYLVRREALLERVSLATGDEHLDIKIVHNQFGALNWREWLLRRAVRSASRAARR